MQYPVGMTFNPESARFEMQNFWEVLFSPVAMARFTHTTSSSFVRRFPFCHNHLLLLSAQGAARGYGQEVDHRRLGFWPEALVFAAFTGDESAYANGRFQPMKMAAYEGLYEGSKGADIVALGILTSGKKVGDGQPPFAFEVSIPKGLSLLARRELNAFVPGIKDLVLWQ